MGDAQYGGPTLDGGPTLLTIKEAFLHASKIELLTDNQIFTASLPPTRVTILEQLGGTLPNDLNHKKKR